MDHQHCDPTGPPQQMGDPLKQPPTQRMSPAPSVARPPVQGEPSRAGTGREQSETLPAAFSGRQTSIEIRTGQFKVNCSPRKIVVVGSLLLLAYIQQVGNQSRHKLEGLWACKNCCRL